MTCKSVLLYNTAPEPVYVGGDCSFCLCLTDDEPGIKLLGTPDLLTCGLSNMYVKCDVSGPDVDDCSKNGKKAAEAMSLSKEGECPHCCLQHKSMPALFGTPFFLCVYHKTQGVHINTLEARL